MRRWRAAELVPPYDPTPEYGQLTLGGSIEAGITFTGDANDGIDALDAWLARIGTINNLVISSGEVAFPRMPDMRQVSILASGTGSVTLSGITITDGVLRCDNSPVYWDAAFGMQSCGLATLTGDPAKLFNYSEGGTVDLSANALSSADVDAILVAAAALPQAGDAAISLYLNGGTMGVPGAAGQAAMAALYNWDLYVNS